MNTGAATTGMPGLSGAAGAASGQYRGWVVALICGVLPAALLAAAAAVPAALWSRLPGHITDHWTLAGTADGDAPRLVPFALIGVAWLESDPRRPAAARTADAGRGNQGNRHRSVHDGDRRGGRDRDGRGQSR